MVSRNNHNDLILVKPIIKERYTNNKAGQAMNTTEALIVASSMKPSMCWETSIVGTMGGSISAQGH